MNYAKFPNTRKSHTHIYTHSYTYTLTHTHKEIEVREGGGGHRKESEKKTRKRTLPDYTQITINLDQQTGSPFFTFSIDNTGDVSTDQRAFCFHMLMLHMKNNQVIN